MQATRFLLIGVLMLGFAGCVEEEETQLTGSQIEDLKNFAVDTQRLRDAAYSSGLGLIGNKDQKLNTMQGLLSRCQSQLIDQTNGGRHIPQNGQRRIVLSGTSCPIQYDEKTKFYQKNEILQIKIDVDYDSKTANFSTVAGLTYARVNGDFTVETTSTYERLSGTIQGEVREGQAKTHFSYRVDSYRELNNRTLEVDFKIQRPQFTVTGVVAEEESRSANSYVYKLNSKDVDAKAMNTVLTSIFDFDFLREVGLFL